MLLESFDNFTYNHRHSYKKWKGVSSSLHFSSPCHSYTLSFANKNETPNMITTKVSDEKFM